MILETTKNAEMSETAKVLDYRKMSVKERVDFATKCVFASRWLITFGFPIVANGGCSFYWSIPYTDYQLVYSGAMSRGANNRLVAVDKRYPSIVSFLSWIPTSVSEIQVNCASVDLGLLKSTLDVFEMFKDMRIKEIEMIDDGIR